MKFFASFAALLLATTACQKEPSKLDGVGAQAPMASTGAAGGGDLEARVRKLEQYTEALEFLQQVYNQQKQQQEAQEASEPAPDAMFAVDISKNVELGMIEGPKVAPVTIIEAWDFA